MVWRLYLNETRVVRCMCGATQKDRNKNEHSVHTKCRQNGEYSIGQSDRRTIEVFGHVRRQRGCRQRMDIIMKPPDRRRRNQRHLRTVGSEGKIAGNWRHSKEPSTTPDDDQTRAKKTLTFHLPYNVHSPCINCTQPLSCVRQASGHLSRLQSSKANMYVSLYSIFKK